MELVICFSWRRLRRCSATCNVTWNASNDTERSGNNKLGKGSGRLFLIQSLKDGLDIHGVDGNVRRGAYGSKVIRMTYNTSE